MTKTIKRIAVFTSGGDAPGMNAAIRSVVRTASHYDLHVYGIQRAYDGMISGEMRRLEKGDVANIIHRGGTILKTARSKEFHTKEGRKQAYDVLKSNKIDACIAIGGNGTFTGAKVFTSEYPDIPFIGLPGTIDNDIYGTDNTIGFDTAVNTAVEAIDKIRDTADSHNRIFFIEVMGRHSGYIALYTGIGSGAGNIFLPETKTNIDDLITQIKMASKRNKLFNIIVVAEGNTNGSAYEIAAQVSAKIKEYETKVAVIGHLQRGGAPSALDRVIATRLGYAAVIALLDGVENKALGIINNKVSYNTFDDAIEKGKLLNKDMLEMINILAR